ncbi:MAG: tRNA (N6-isopentenyl adenosine(37)-C2)-methylthiotransferase MiaB [Oligosphaeraceae bacterium]|nr:tRNA (N6-isopentenyl adenosine(37)-C2)-methylthiotransferase MiaB [Oligosphaeraceae bacterium]
MFTFHIRTYGCQMNERDSEALACLLSAHGHQEVSEESAADLLLFNTCSVRDQAERKVLGKIGLLKRVKRQKPQLKIGLIGCMGQRLGDQLFTLLPHLDFVVGSDQLSEIPGILERIAAGERHISATVMGTDDFMRLTEHKTASPFSYISIIQGCNQFCSYCIVPYTRGRERSRDMADIVHEVRRQVERGTREILLLGQNITAYGIAEARKEGRFDPEESYLADLLCKLNEIEGLRRIRFTSPHVRFMNDKFIRTICELPKVCKAFHIPVQSGCNRILKAMNRGYTIEEYLHRIEQIRELVPEAQFSTDIIVGFPSETNTEFEQTLELMRKVQYDMAYIFRYSTRSGTKAAEKLLDDVSEEEKNRRNQVLLEELSRGTEKRNRARVGQSLEVLLEGASKRNPERWTGRCRLNKVVNFPWVEGLQVGELRQVKIKRSSANALYGEIEP